MWKKKSNFDKEVSEAKLIVLVLAGLDFNQPGEKLAMVTWWFLMWWIFGFIYLDSPDLSVDFDFCLQPNKKCCESHLTNGVFLEKDT